MTLRRASNGLIVGDVITPYIGTQGPDLIVLDGTAAARTATGLANDTTNRLGIAATADAPTPETGQTSAPVDPAAPP